MKIYLIRHGQSQAHLLGQRQGPKTPLSEEGILQSKKASLVFKNLQLATIISSPWERALQTAKIISDCINIPVKVIDYIHEKKLHPDLYYANLDSDINKAYLRERYANDDNFNWKFKRSSESIAQVYKRAKSFKKYVLRNYKYKDILVVTHGIFLFCFIMSAILGKDFDEKFFMKLLANFVCSNAGISLLEYQENKDNWKLRYFNNISHLM